MKPQFADTSFWFARQVGTDQRHQAAKAICPAPRVVTTELVLGETWTLINRRFGHRAALNSLRSIRRIPGITVDATTATDHRQAWTWLEQHDEREYSFVDAVSFAVMRRRRITDALAFDGDFAAAGFVEVRA